MTYYQVNPHPALQPFVESIGIQESDELSSGTTTVLPTTCMDMLFHYRDQFIQHHEAGDSTEPTSYLCGQLTRPLTVSAAGRTGIVVVSFYPWALPAFTRVNPSAFTDLSVPLAEIFCRSLIEEVQDRIFHSQDANERIRVVERFLLKVLQTSSVNCFEVCAVNRINAAMGSIRIGQLARSLDISPRQLNRRFLQVVGLSPKKFSAINRFQKALLFKHSGWSTGDVLAETGYYDQAHFIHDFQRYAQSSPEQIFSADADTPLMKQFNPVNRAGNVTHFYNTLYLQ